MGVGMVWRKSLRSCGRRVAVAAILLGLLLIGVGCRSVMITTEPSGAMIRLDGREVGESPMSLRVWQGLFMGRGQYLIEAEKAGYAVAGRRFREGTFDNVRTAIPAEVHFLLLPATPPRE